MLMAIQMPSVGSVNSDNFSGSKVRGFLYSGHCVGAKSANKRFSLLPRRMKAGNGSEKLKLGMKLLGVGKRISIFNSLLLHLYLFLRSS